MDFFKLKISKVVLAISIFLLSYLITGIMFACGVGGGLNTLLCSILPIPYNITTGLAYFVARFFYGLGVLSVSGANWTPVIVLVIWSYILSCIITWLYRKIINRT